jgi:hypothetical protein
MNFYLFFLGYLRMYMLFLSRGTPIFLYDHFFRVRERIMFDSRNYPQLMYQIQTRIVLPKWLTQGNMECLISS